MTYAIKLNGFYFNGINCQGLETYGSDACNAKHFYDRAEAQKVSDRITGSEVVLVPMWAL